MDGVVSWLSAPEAGLLLWGLYSRLLGLVYAIALLAFVPQLIPLSGNRGITPCAPALRTARQHFGSLAALWWFPSFFWISSADFMLVLIPLVGGLSGLAVAVLGGSWSPFLLRLAWACLLSIDAGCHTLVYPWDSLLLEVGFIAPFLPASVGLGADGLLLQCLPAAALPSPLLQWAHRWVLFRLMVGFGKLKFVGTGWQDRFYIH